MLAHAVTPILNVSDIAGELRLVREARLDEGLRLGQPADLRGGLLGQVRDLPLPGAQGGRGKSGLPTTKGHGEAGDKGVWMSVWVDDVDAVHRHCLDQGIEVTMPPTDEPWNVREMHVRHPDGHVFRISKGIEEAE